MMVCFALVLFNYVVGFLKIDNGYVLLMFSNNTTNILIQWLFLLQCIFIMILIENMQKVWYLKATGTVGVIESNCLHLNRLKSLVSLIFYLKKCEKVLNFELYEYEWLFFITTWRFLHSRCKPFLQVLHCFLALLWFPFFRSKQTQHPFSCKTRYIKS